MKYILKDIKNEPKEVVEKRNTPGSSFDDLPKEPLRIALLKEQGYICAYCMQRIKNNRKTTKIEHWAPRNKNNEKNYMNLLAVCNGKEGQKGQEHYDTLKRDNPINISPLDIKCEQILKFDPGGKIYSNDGNIDKELNELLGLNRQHLVDERMKLLDTLKDDIQKSARNNPDSKIKKSRHKWIIANMEIKKERQI